MKKCINCLIAKPLSEFYRHDGMADGHLNKCKQCCKTYQKRRRRTHPELTRRIERKKYLKRQMQHLAKAKEWRQNHRTAVRRIQKAYNDRYPEKYICHCMLANAVRNGRIAKGSCVVCGNPQSQGHHDDYSRPYDVVWLCDKHHKELHYHRKHGQAGVTNKGATMNTLTISVRGRPAA